MANLETLELTISANAQSASQGVASLTNSLSALSKAVGKTVGGLQRLNAELSKLKGVGRINIGGSSGGSSASKIKAQTKAITENAKATQTWAEAQAAAGYPLTSNRAKGASGGAFKYRFLPIEEAKKAVTQAQGKSDLYNWSKASTKMWNFMPKETGAFVSKYGKGEKWSTNFNPNSGYETKGKASDFFEQSKAMQEAGKAAEEYEKKTGGALQRVGRIASTMLIRTALRAIIKGFKEAWESCYNFSKSMNGEFAQSVDKIRGLLKGAAINITSAFAPAITALLPVINAVAAAITYLANAVKWLLSLFGLGAGLFGATAEQIGAIGGAAGGSGGKVKEMLASFDELNVISQESGGGGGGGGGGGALSNVMSDELAAITTLASEFMLAVGLILAFTGHPFIGAALIALGVAGIVGPIATKWGELSDEIKGQIVTIMAVAGVAFLALGLILALTGANIPLGIGLIAAGAANMVAAGVLAWGFDDTIKGKVASLEAAVGGASLALGAILTFTGVNIPLGIALLAFGAISLGHSLALSWGMDDKIQNIVKNLDVAVGGAALALGALLCFTGASIPLGLGLLAFGAVKVAHGLAEELGFDEKIIGILEGIETAAGIASLAIGAILLFTGVNIPLGLGLLALGGVSLASAIAPHWDSIVADINGAMEQVRVFIVNAWNDICTAVDNAWNSIVQWWDDNIAQNVSKAWDAVTTWLSDTWESVSNAVTDAWNAVSEWWGDVKTSIGAAWSATLTWLSGAWESVQTAVYNAWNTVKNWWTENIVGNLETAWNTVTTFFQGIFEGIGGFFNTMWSSVEKLWGDIVTSVETAWSSVGQWFFDNVTSPIGNFFIDCVNGVIDGINFLIGILNSIHITIPAVSLPLIGDLWGETTIGISGIAELEHLAHIGENASGAYGIPKGDLFLANENGAELVGQMNGRPSVANQQQIVEGIEKGVRDANSEQNALLRQQNDLLRAILAKQNTGGFNPSASFGRTVSQSLEMYNTIGG